MEGESALGTTTTTTTSQYPQAKQSIEQAAQPNDEVDFLELENEETRQKIISYKESYQVEIRGSKRKEILKRNRDTQKATRQSSQLSSSATSTLYQQAGQQTPFNYPPPSMNSTYLQQLIDSEQVLFDQFMKQQVIFDIDECTGDEMQKNIFALVGALNRTQSAYFFYLTTQELEKYFDDDSNACNGNIELLYSCINIVIQSNILSKILEIIQTKWQQSLIEQTDIAYSSTEAATTILNEQPFVLRKQILGCFSVIAAISRGSDIQCNTLKEGGFFQIIFDVFFAVKEQRDFAEILIFIIGNLISTRPSWNLYFAQRNFHNIIITYLQYAPKNEENLVLHRRICLCIQTFTREYPQIRQALLVTLKKNQQQFQQQYDQMNGTPASCSSSSSSSNQSEEYIADGIINASIMKHLTRTFVAYISDFEIQTDIATAFTNIMISEFSDIDKSQKEQSSPEERQNAVSRRILKLLEIGCLEFMKITLQSNKLASLTPLYPLRMVRRIFRCNDEVISYFLTHFNEHDLLSAIQRCLDTKKDIIRKETISVLYQIFYRSQQQHQHVDNNSDFIEKIGQQQHQQQLKPVQQQQQQQGLISIDERMWSSRFLVVLVPILCNSDAKLKEDIYKLLTISLRSVSKDVFDSIVFNEKHSVFLAMKDSLIQFYLTSQGVLYVIESLMQIITYYPVEDISSKPALTTILATMQKYDIPNIVQGLQHHELEAIYQAALDFVETFNQILKQLKRSNEHL